MSIPVSIDLLGTLGGELPPGYKQMRYIASTVGGGQYIDTGVVADANTAWMLDWMPLEDNVFSACGSFVGSGHYAMDYDAVDAHKFRITRSAVIVARKRQDPIGTRLAVILDVPNLRCKFGEDDWQEITSNNIYPNFPLTLFGRNKGSGIDYLTASRIFASKIWKNGQLVSDLRPALDPQGRPCMYNLAGTGSVEQNTFYNSGSGEFLYQ